MKILFLARNCGYFRNFESIIRELASRGHEIHLAVERDETAGGRPIVDALASAFTNITVGEAPSRASDDWSWIASRFRLGLDYLRYQHRLFDDTPKLRERARERTPGAFVALGNAVRRFPWSRRAVSALVRRCERAVPADPAIRDFLNSRQPDVMILTPLIDLGSSQIDYLRAARKLEVPTALGVWSWDHLSSKALIRDVPDRVFVWNDVQKQEAIKLHGVPADRLIVTGAQCFDQWFDRQPSRDRETFCQHVGLPSSPPFLLWVCSALFHGSPSEAEFVVEWIRQVRQSPLPRLRDAPILVRPHPSRVPEWDGIDVGTFGNVVLWGSNPVDTSSRSDYFDSLHHSAVVIGLNTSAFIEAGIVGRSVHTILVPQFYENQKGTVHFRYLLDAGGGLLNVAEDFDAHLEQLDRALAHPSSERRPFVTAFVRPRGLNVPATPVFADHVEDMTGLKVSVGATSSESPLVRAVLRRLTTLRTSERFEHLAYSERELEGMIRLRDVRTAKAGRQAARRAQAAARRRQRLEERQARESAKRLHAEQANAARQARLLEKERYRQAKRARAASGTLESSSEVAGHWWRRLSYAWCLIVALSVGYFLIRIPVQVTDSLANLIQVQDETWLQSFTAGVGGGYLRPLLWGQLKTGFELAGGNYTAMFRGIHVAQLLMCCALFVGALRVRNIAGACAIPFGLAMFLGAHTFDGTVREAFPINSYLSVVIGCLAAVNLSFGRPAWWRDVTAILLLLVLLLTVESGVLIWVCLFTAWGTGARGISSRGIVAATACVAMYVLVRFVLLDVGTPALFERPSGFGFSTIEPQELQTRFGSWPYVFYAYNVLCQVGTVLFSEPRTGVFAFLRNILNDRVTIGQMISILTTTLATLLIAWYSLARASGWRRAQLDAADRVVLVFLAVLVANAVISFPYTKDVIVSPAGAFHALAATVAISELLRRLAHARPMVVATVSVFVALVAAGSSVRLTGQYYMLRQASFNTRNEWTELDNWARRNRIDVTTPHRAALVRRLYDDAIESRVPSPTFANPRWARYFY